MIRFTTSILKFGQQGEKTGWTYILINAKQAEKLKPGNKKSFRVKGKLDNWTFSGMALIPMGEGEFIMALNADVRKKIGKRKGDNLLVELEADEKAYQLDSEFMLCLADEPEALKFFNSLAGSHRNYFSKWIESAKTEPTRAKRIAMAVNALQRKWGYPEMIRDAKNKRNETGW